MVAPSPLNVVLSWHTERAGAVDVSVVRMSSQAGTPLFSPDSGI